MLKIIGILFIFLAFIVSGCAGEEEEAEEVQGEVTIAQEAKEEVEEVEEEEIIEEEKKIEPTKENTYYVSVSSDSFLTMRETPGSKDKPEDDVLDRLNRNEKIVVTNKYDNSKEKDGFIWWEVYDPSTETAGWVAKEFLSKEELKEEKIIVSEYYPLSVGLKWTYIAGSGGNLQTTMWISSVTGSMYVKEQTTYLDGDEAIKVSSNINVDSDGNINELSGNSKLLILKNNVTVGDSWSYRYGGDDVTRKVMDFKSVKTQAGNFDKCLVIEEKTVLDDGVTYIAKYYYALNIGLVKKVGIDSSTGEENTIFELRQFTN